MGLTFLTLVQAQTYLQPQVALVSTGPIPRFPFNPDSFLMTAKNRYPHEDDPEYVSFQEIDTAGREHLPLGATNQPLGPILRKKGTWRKAKFSLFIQMVLKGDTNPPRGVPHRPLKMSFLPASFLR